MIALFSAFRDILYHTLEFFQQATEPVLRSQSYWFSIVLLTLSVRILLIPLTVKQVRSTRAMQEIQPEIKKIQAKFKNDRAKQNEELMRLYRERGFNPMSGCWPIAAQFPFFIALYRIFFSPKISGKPNILLDKTFFGVPLQQRWSALHGVADKFGSAAGLTILALIVAMSVTTYISQKQLMAKQGQVNPQQQMLVRIMPVTFLVFAVNVPLAVVIYWVTTNLWSMGQQWFILRSAPVPAGGTPTPAPAASAGPSERKGLGVFDMFRNVLQPDSDTSSAKPSDNGSDGAGGRKGAVTGKGTAKPQQQSGGPAPPPKDAQSNSGQGRTQGSGRAQGAGGGQRPNARGQRPSGGGRSSGKGKAGGQQRRGKR